MNSKLYAALVAASLTVTSAIAFAQPAMELTNDPAAVQAGAYGVEPLHTRVLFSVSHMGFTTWYGEFTNVSGTLNLDLDGELKSDAWLDAGQFPEMVFKSTKVTETGKDAAKVTGDLTFHGVTKPVTLAVKFNGAGTNPLDKKYTAGFEVSGQIKRSDFGVKTYVPLIGDDVDLIISAGFEHK
jgi:polyisoprenoid-binding protein YceI